MKKLSFILAIGILLCNSVRAQQWGTLYIAAGSGLNMRSMPDEYADVLDKIPYGTKITLIQSDDPLRSMVSEGMTGYWQKVNYNNKTGYILDCYLLPWAPPKITGSTEENPFGMKNYLAQATTPFGNKLVVKSGKEDGMDDGGWTLSKQLYKNGAEWHNLAQWESGSDEYFLPGFSIEQGFLLVRLLPEFKEVFGENDEFPSESRTFKKGDIEYVIRVDKQSYFGEGDYSYSWYEKLHVEFSPGASYSFDLFRVGNQLVISFGGGV